MLEAAIKIAEKENLTAKEMKLLRIAILYHDSGFLHSYKNHEEEGCKLVQEDLPPFGYTTKEINIICEIIMATQIPQSPKTLLEKIILTFVYIRSLKNPNQ